MMRWWAVIAWLLATGPAGANVPPAGPFAYDAVGHWLARAVTGGVLTNQTHSFDANAARCRLDFGYDYLGRRIAKTVLTNWNGSGYQATNLTRFVYDSSAGQAGLSAGQAGVWNLIAVLNSAFSLQTSFLWGLDLSGSEQGAGGIGGLLMVTEHGASVTNHFVAYDGNGNVTALLRTDGAVSARYEYGPFGEPIRATGPMAKLNPFRWSTKYWDHETDLVYYGYRYYSPSLGRWISRDPIEEQGGLSLYAYCVNSPLTRVDPKGSSTISTTIAIGIGQYLVGAGWSVGLDLLWGKPIDWADALITGTVSAAGFGALKFLRVAKDARQASQSIWRILNAPGFKIGLGEMNGPIGKALQSGFGKRDLLTQLLAAQGGAFVAELLLDADIDLFGDE